MTPYWNACGFVAGRYQAVVTAATGAALLDGQCRTLGPSGVVLDSAATREGDIYVPRRGQSSAGRPTVRALHPGPLRAGRDDADIPLVRLAEMRDNLAAHDIR